MSITPITTHEVDALARMLEQDKDSPKLAALVSAFASQIQEIENALNDVVDARAIATATGTNLDRLAGLVGFTRPVGTSDAIMRILTLGKIGLNISQGETERVIDVYRLLTQASRVYMQEYSTAAISMSSDGTVPVELVNTVRDFLDDVVAGGVAVLYFGIYDPDNPFVFAGDPDGSGFGDVNDAAVGGQLAYLLAPT